MQVGLGLGLGLVGLVGLVGLWVWVSVRGFRLFGCKFGLKGGKLGGSTESKLEP